MAAFSLIFRIWEDYRVHHCFQILFVTELTWHGLPDSKNCLLGNRRTSVLTHGSITIVVDGRPDVCDGAHRVFVMKAVEGPAFAAR